MKRDFYFAPQLSSARAKAKKSGRIIRIAGYSRYYYNPSSYSRYSKYEKAYNAIETLCNCREKAGPFPGDTKVVRDLIQRLKEVFNV